MEKDRKMTTEEIVRLASETAANAAIARYETMKRKHQQRRVDRRLRDTRRLLSKYHEIKEHTADAVSELSDLDDETYDFFKAMMEDDNSIDVQAIVTSKVKSCIFLAHIDTMLEKYKQIAYASHRPEEIRYYNTLYDMYIADEKKTPAEIAEKAQIHERTVYKDLDNACERMGSLLFGVQWIERGED